MAKKTTKQQSADGLLATFFFALIGQVFEEFRKPGRMSSLGYAVRELIESKTNEFFREFLPGTLSPDSQEALKLLFGLADGYPYTYEAVARSVGKSPQQLREMEEALFKQAVELSGESIARMRTDWLEKHPCMACAVKVGDVHKFGCKQEECPFCHCLLSECLCAYKHLKLGWGGRSAREWKQMEKQQSGYDWDERLRKKHIRPLTSEQERQWAAIVLKKGCITYGTERRFQ